MTENQVSPWIRYVEERIPLPTLGFLILGMVLSASQIALGQYLWIASIPPFLHVLAFFVLLRTMDDYKDIDKDLVVHPDRPFARGAFQRTEIQAMINRATVILFVMAGITALTGNPTAGLCYATVVGYLWLMYKEFFVGAWLEQRPLLYAATHQVIILALAAYLIAAFNPERLYDNITWGYGLVLLSGFFAYEVGRKSDPKAHPVQRTYVQVYGQKASSALVVGAMIIGAIGAYYAGIPIFLWSLQFTVIVAAVALAAVLNNRYQNLERVTTTSLVIHCWAGAIQALFVTVGG